MNKNLIHFLSLFVLGFLFLFTFVNVSAETFTDSSRFSYYVYNNNTLMTSGRGLFTYQTSKATRTELLYQSYTFFNQYYYDITLDISIDSGNWYSNATGCNIGIPGAATFTSYFSKDYSGDVGHLKCSVYNFTANQLNNLFINFYNNQGQTILYNIVKYELSINAKQNTSPTSEGINQGFNSVINNQNNNTQSIIDKLEQDNNYTNEGETPEGKEDMDDLKEQEGELLDTLDLSGAEDIDITINPETNNFIWNIVERLRGMNSAIVTLITSVLGMGIIKMILNR